jgi:branched-chain amino acid transport system ATP-binding protein
MVTRHPHLHEHETILEVKNLSVSYSKIEALHDISLTIRRGEIVTVIGPNGAGKTTLLLALMGLLPAVGSIVYMGQVQGREREVEHLVRHGMTLVPEKRELFAEMSVEDNLVLGAFDRYRTGHRDHMETMDEVFELFPRLEERRAQLAGTLSGGERQMLAIARGLMPDPDLLMLDEPSLGLAPLVVASVFEEVAYINQQGMTVFLVEQNARRALAIAQRAYVLELGQIRYEGTGSDLLNNEDVQRSYLGA